MNTGDKITLDTETFKVLASETRINILKKLDKSQLTVSDLARVMEMSKATLYEHLEKLIGVGLIKKKEDGRKWVYYKLTWKGKNIVHPERTKIAIALTVFILVFIIVSSFYIISGGYKSLLPEEKDITNQSTVSIEFEVMDDINENTISTNKIIISIHKNIDLNKSTIEIEYSIQEDYTKNIDSIKDWYDLRWELIQNKISTELPSLNWSKYADNYLYIKCKIKENTGNYIQNIYVEYIETIFENSVDLSIKKSDVEFRKNIDTIPRENFQNIPIRIKIHNTGPYDVKNISFTIFSEEPDHNFDGLVDNFNNSILTKQIDLIEAHKVKNIEIDIVLNLSKTETFWICIDPNNDINESNEFNNIVNITLKSFFSTSKIPEFSTTIGLFLVIFILFLYCFTKKRYLNK